MSREIESLVGSLSLYSWFVDQDGTLRQITSRIILWSSTLVKLLGAQSNGILSLVFLCSLNFWCHAWTMCCTVCHYQEVLESKNTVSEVSYSCFCDSRRHLGRKKMLTKLHGLVSVQNAESPYKFIKRQGVGMLWCYIRFFMISWISLVGQGVGPLWCYRVFHMISWFPRFCPI